MRPISPREQLPRWLIAMMAGGPALAVGGGVVYYAEGGSAVVLLLVLLVAPFPLIPWLYRRQTRTAVTEVPPDTRTDF